MALPPGLLLNPQTGELTGVPTLPGVYSIALKVRDAIGTTRELSEEVTIYAYTPMTWSGDLGHMMANRPATQITLASANGIAPYAYSVYSGALPSGLTINASTGVISGTPSTPGGYAAVIRVTDNVGGQADVVIAGTVADELTMIYGGDGRGEVGLAENELLGVNGGTTPYTYSVVDSLPPGYTFADARVQGTPTSAYSGSSTLRVTDAYGFITDTTIVWDIATRPTLTGLSSHATVGTAFSGSLSGAGGHAPYVFGWVVANPFNGLSLDPATGVVSGTPTTSTDINVQAELTDDLGVAAPSAAIIVQINAALVVSGAYAAKWPINQSGYSFTPSTAGGWGPYTYSISVGTLPTGLSINAGTGAITGTPTQSGTFNTTLRVVDHDGNVATMAFNIVIAGTLSMTGGVTNYATGGVAYNGSTLAGAGGSTPYSFSIASGALPPGLAFNSATGAITGSPSGSFGIATTYNFTVKLTDANNSTVSNSFSITVADMPTLAGTAPDGSTGTAYSFAYAVSGGHQPLTYSIASGALPTGLSLNTSTGVISGTPSSAASYSFAIRATDAHGNVVTHATDSVTIFAGVSLSGTLTAQSEQGDFYSSGLTASAGGKQPYSWSVQGTLPLGLVISASTGVISGTPGRTTVSGTYSFTVVCTDQLGKSGSSVQTITVHTPVQFTGGYATGGTAGIAYDNTPPAVSNGWTPYAYALASGALPGGTSLNASTGVISGTLSAAGTYNFAIRVTDNLGVIATLSRTVTVNAAVGLTGVPADGTAGVAYSFAPAISGGWGPFAYSISAGALPPGCALNSSTGQVTGTPTTPGSYNFTIHVVDTATYGGSAASLACATTIVAKPVLSLTAPRGEVAYAYSGSSSVSGGHAPLSYARVAGTLPPGVALNASTGALSGTATTAGTYSFTIRVTDALGNIDDAAATVQIAAQISNTTNFPDGRVGVAYSGSATSSGGWTPKTYSVASGTLPTGLSLSAAGVLSGTPSAAGTYAFVLRVTDGDSHTATSSQSIVIAAATAALAISASPNPASASVQSTGSPVSASATSTATAAGGTAPYSYAWSFLSATQISGAAGAFSITHPAANKITASQTQDGTPEYDRIENWRCTVTDNVGATAHVDISIEIDIFGTQ